MITEEQLKLFAPAINELLIPEVVEYFNKYSDQYAVSTPPRIAAFFAQVIHESGSFKYTREIWGPTAAQKRYEGRKDLGNDHPGDGYNFRGWGYMQVTGRGNTRTVSEALFNDDRLLQIPEFLDTHELAMRASFWYWQSRDLNKWADLPPDQKITTKKFGIVTPYEWLTILINGGRNGLQERIQIYNRICKILSLPETV